MYWLRRLLLGIPSTQQWEIVDGTLTPLPAAPQVSHFERHGNYGVKTSVPAPASMAPILDYQSGIPTTLKQDSMGSTVTSTNRIFHSSTGEWVGTEKRSEEPNDSDGDDSVPELV
ncbi:hypothetical protein DFH09DRAFT_1161360 [Mycena vulgaris]|nr:hypothetical protein DFH09DRAFT_1161360 [Mycena vulgaris]